MAAYSIKISQSPTFLIRLQLRGEELSMFHYFWRASLEQRELRRSPFDS